MLTVAAVPSESVAENVDDVFVPVHVAQPVTPYQVAVPIVWAVVVPHATQPAVPTKAYPCIHAEQVHAVALVAAPVVQPAPSAMQLPAKKA